MKKKIRRYAATALLMFISFAGFSQDGNNENDVPKSIPAWVSENGYWVVETNIHQPLQCMVKFYNNQDVMIGVKEISGKKMNIKRSKVKMQLKSMLETSLQAWAGKKPVSNNEELAKKP